MPSFNEGYASLARLSGHAKRTGDGAIVIPSAYRPLAARERVAAAMSAAMMTGDVDGVVAALSLLGGQSRREGAPRN